MVQLGPDLQSFWGPLADEWCYKANEPLEHISNDGVVSNNS